MVVKHNGVHSMPRSLHGSGAQGATMGILEYLSQSNDNSDFVNQEDKYKFVDDLSILEIVNLLTIGISFFNIKYQVPNDIPTHNQYISAENLLSQSHLDNVHIWTNNQKMLINEKKSKTMIFDFTDNFQFTTRLKINNIKG